MTLLLSIVVLALAVLLAFVTLIQMLYMDLMRLRTKDLPMLQVFRASIDEHMDLKAENGVLAFSLIKHSLLAFVGVLIFQARLGRNAPTIWNFLEAAFGTWVMMLLFSYIIPQFLYRRTTGNWLTSCVPLLRFLVLLVKPLTALLGLLQSLSQLGEKDEELDEPASQQDNIEALITAGTEEGIIEEEDRKLIHSVVAFGNKKVREVMTARPDVVAIEAGVSLEDLRKLVIHEQFSRIPVYEETIDHPIGFIHVRDMFELDYTERAHRQVRDLARPIRLVPETKPVNDLLREMQADGAHMAVVVDEYGNTAGLVTMEDMVEEIVGEIRDEHEPGLDVEVDSEGGYIVSGSFDVDHLRDLLEYRPQDDTEATTVGGLVTEWMGRVPQPGESVERDGIRIEVLGANELRVDQVRISKAEPAPNA